jgi:S1-C subfamily serine protease
VTQKLYPNAANYKVISDFFGAFCDTYKSLDNNSSPIQPAVLSYICENLNKNRILSKITLPFVISENNDHTIYFTPIKLNQGVKLYDCYNLNSLVFGFKYIYEVNKKNVLPIIVRKNNIVSIGSCFYTDFGIITAKHCLDVDEAQIGDGNATVFPEILNETPIYSSELYDIAVIDYKCNNKSIIPCLPIGEVECLDEVLTMGYPKHSGFLNFITATKGSVAAIEEAYLPNARHKFLLLNSAISGGNSGGPVLNHAGEAVGIITDKSYGESSEQIKGKKEGENKPTDYANLGYGLAIPIEYASKIYNAKIKLDHKIKFVSNLGDKH